MNTDEPLVQLDFDETNLTNHLQPNEGIQHIIINSHTNQRPSSPPLTSETFTTDNTASSSKLVSQRIDDTNLLTSTIFRDGTADVPAHLQHHCGAFSDDNKLSSVTHTFVEPNSHSNQYLNVINDRNNINSKDLIETDDSNSLVTLSRSHSSLIQNECDHSIENQQTIELNRHEASNSKTHDDTVEVSLLADLSMDSRESQPLLGREAHDYVHNNFPGKILIHFTCIYCMYTFHYTFQNYYTFSLFL